MELLLFGIAPRPPAAPGLIAQTSPGCSSREGWAGSGGKKKNLWAFVCFPCSPLKCCAKGNSSWRPGFGSPCYAAETSGYALGEPGARPHAPLGSVSQPRLSGVVGACVTSSPPTSDGLLQPSPRGRVLFFFSSFTAIMGLQVNTQTSGLGKVANCRAVRQVQPVTFVLLGPAETRTMLQP